MTAQIEVRLIEFVINEDETTCNLFYTSSEQESEYWGGGWKTKSFPKTESIIDFLNNEIENYIHWDNGAIKYFNELQPKAQPQPSMEWVKASERLPVGKNKFDTLNIKYKGRAGALIWLDDTWYWQDETLSTNFPYIKILGALSNGYPNQQQQNKKYMEAVTE